MALAPLPERGDCTVRPEAPVSIAQLDWLVTQTSMSSVDVAVGTWVACDSVDQALTYQSTALVLAVNKTAPSIADVLGETTATVTAVASAV